MRDQRQRIVALTAVLVLGAAACGDDDDGTAATGGGTATTAETTTTIATEEGSEEDLERVAEAAENTVDQGTATFTISVETTGTGAADGEVPVDVEGEVDFEQERRRLLFSAETGTLEVLVDGTELYIEMPATEEETWARLDLDELLEGDVGFGGPAGLPFQDPARNLELLQSTSEVEVGDSETVGGVDATRYRVLVDLEAAAEEAETDAGDALDRTVEESGLSELEMDVWVDDDDLIRRVTYSIDLSGVSAEVEEEGAEAEVDASGQVSVTMEYDDFGTDVDVDLPEDDQVIDLDEEELRQTFEGVGGTSGTAGSGTGGTATTSGAGDSDEDDATTTTTSG